MLWTDLVGKRYLHLGTACCLPLFYPLRRSLAVEKVLDRVYSSRYDKYELLYLNLQKRENRFQKPLFQKG